MRLTDLSPRWLMKDGRRIGFIFRSPTKLNHPAYQSCFENPPPMREQLALFCEATKGEVGAVVQGCNQAAHWTIAGGIDNADFNSISVTPSLDGSAGGFWHGYITNGAIVGGL